MASLIFAASYMTYNKIKSKREEKKEKKRKAYADRYSELERAQRKDAEKQLQLHNTADSPTTTELRPSPIQAVEQPLGGRRSSESATSKQEKTDGPSTWVDDVIRERSRGGEGGVAPKQGIVGEEAKGQSLI